MQTLYGRVLMVSVMLAIASPALAGEVDVIDGINMSHSHLQVEAGDWSLSAGAMNWYYDEDGLAKSAVATGASLRLGHQVTPNYGWEAVVASGGAGNTSIPQPGLGSFPTAIDLDILVGGLFRPVITRDRWQLYGLVGVSYVQVSARSTDPLATPSNSRDSALSLSYGAGGEVMIINGWALDLEWAQYVGGQFGGFSFLVKRYFKSH